VVDLESQSRSLAEISSYPHVARSRSRDKAAEFEELQQRRPRVVGLLLSSRHAHLARSTESLGMRGHRRADGSLRALIAVIDRELGDRQVPDQSERCSCFDVGAVFSPDAEDTVEFVP
jgi:hypothetical protein